MHYAALITVTLLIAAGPAAATATFEAPSQWTGNLVASTSWALLLVGPSGALGGGFTSDKSTTATEYHVLKTALNAGLFGFDDPRPIDSSTESLNAVDASLAGRPAVWKSVFIEADSITAQLNGSGQILTAGQGSEAMDVLTEQSYPDGLVRPFGPTIAQASAVLAGSFAEAYPTKLVARGVRSVEVHNITLSCQAACPRQSDSGSFSQSVDRRTVGMYSLNYLNLATTSANVSIEADAVAVAVGGSSVDTTVSGQVRLADFMVNQCRPEVGCVSASGETLVANGTVRLQGLRMASDGKLDGDLVLTSATARLDEAVFDADVLGPGIAIVSAVAVGGLLLFKLLGLLFTRIRDPDALANPKRQMALEGIRASPGVSVALLARRTGLARSTLKHHVDILVQLGIVERRGFGKAVRLFDKRLGSAAHEGFAMMQGPGARSICELVSRTPGITQTDILDSIPGVPRSSVQFQLGRLEDIGILHRAKVGRRVHYGPGPQFPKMARALHEIPA
jgi:predicted transcriptional regulator